MTMETTMIDEGDVLKDFFAAPDHVLEWTRVDGTSDAQRFDDRKALYERYDRMVADEPEAVFIVAASRQAYVRIFRRDRDGSISTLSPERRKRAGDICAAMQIRAGRRWKGWMPGDPLPARVG
jgi:hypothetical protein